MKLNDLLEQKRALDEQIEAIQKAEKATAIASIQALMRDHGVSLRDLGGAKRRVSVGVAKYRDPATGATWTGRGRKPGWMHVEGAEAFMIAA